MAFERIVDKDDARAIAFKWLGLGDKHNVVETGNACLKQFELFLRLVLRGDVLHGTQQPLADAFFHHSPSL